MKPGKKLSESILDKFTIDYLRSQVLKNAYGNNDTVIASIDPRLLLIWYLFFAIAPWFAHNIIFLGGCFIIVAVTTVMAHVAPLVLFIFALGVFSQTGYLLIVSLFFGGDLSTLIALLILTLKVATVSLASITVFSGLDPDRLASGLLEEFQNVLLSYRLRGNPPQGRIKYLCYQVKIIIQSFYPMILNTAKRSRTTVEVLEIKGYRYAASDRRVRKIKLSMLKVTDKDLLFMTLSFLWVSLTVLAATLI